MSVIPNDVSTSHHYAWNEKTMWEVLDASTVLMGKAAKALLFSVYCGTCMCFGLGFLYIVFRIVRWLFA